MFRDTIRVGIESDTENLIAALQAKARGAGVPEQSLVMMTTRARTALAELVHQGREMSSIGSTLAAQQTLKGDDYEVVIDFGVGGKPSLLERVGYWLKVR